MGVITYSPNTLITSEKDAIISKHPYYEAY